MDYFIKKGYKENVNSNGEVVERYSAPPLDKVFQVSVYNYARKLLLKNKLNNVIEFGTGSGYKLNKYFSSICDDIAGIDYPHSITYSEKKYPNIKWFSEDFDNLSDFQLAEKYDLVMSIDVIEHLVSPENLLESMKIVSHENTYILLSTPERDLVRGAESMGPPENKKHVREWNQSEFREFITSMGFEIISHENLEAFKPTIRQKFYHLRKGINNNTCQVILCKLKSQS